LKYIAIRHGRQQQLRLWVVVVVVVVFRLWVVVFVVFRLWVIVIIVIVRAGGAAECRGQHAAYYGGPLRCRTHRVC